MSRPVRPPAVHIDGDYCARSGAFFNNLDRLVEAKDAIESDPQAVWRWKDGICSTCAKSGGVLLFNRAIGELRAHQAGTEHPAVVERREARRTAHEARLATLATVEGRRAERIRKREEKLLAKAAAQAEREARRAATNGGAP